MFDLIKGWQKIDNETEEKIQGIARFIRPITFDFCPISCGSCNKAIATVEDVQMMKKELEHHAVKDGRYRFHGRHEELVCALAKRTIRT